MEVYCVCTLHEFAFKMPLNASMFSLTGGVSQLMTASQWPLGAAAARPRNRGTSARRSDKKIQWYNLGKDTLN